MLIINDVHAGVQRKGGTTPASQEALRTYLFDSLEALLTETQERDILILGDLFDTFEVPLADWIRTYHILAETIDRGKHIILVAGNHDNSPRGGKVSSFTALCEVLQSRSSAGRVTVYDVGQSGPVPGGWVIPHCANQDLFNIELQKVLELDFPPEFLFLHANYDNNFAVNADHSLNVSMEQAAAISAGGTTLVFAHEHQARADLGGKVVVLGNQWPTSVSDCLNNDKKFAHVLRGGQLTKLETWDKDSEAGYAEVNWTDLDDALEVSFIRVSGTASSAQASDAVNAVAAFRQSSNAFVITNAVKVEGIAEIEELPAQFEAAKAFDVLSFIKQHLDADEIAVVEQLLKD